MSSDITDWYRNIPYFTKIWLTSMVLTSISAGFGFLPQYYLILTPSVYRDYQIWRLFTSLFFVPLGIYFLFLCFYLYNYSSRLENDEFKNKPADYLYLLLFCWSCSIISSLVLGMMIIAPIMISSVLYIWCKINKDVIVTFMFGTRFKAIYFPWILLLLDLLISGGMITTLMGIFIGHLYYFLKFQYPQEYQGISLLETPNLLNSLYPATHGGIHFANNQRQSTGQTSRQQGFFSSSTWGNGNVLGRD